MHDVDPAIAVSLSPPVYSTATPLPDLTGARQPLADPLSLSSPAADEFPAISVHRRLG
uniref:Uncharacterized protein n=1 Tax=Oryza sativa subsp. japonica TaxID=39947 RepID=Q69Q79_ORYSJ|nr:hypothetical protein [Oryza sativa Japonica Group]